MSTQDTSPPEDKATAWAALDAADGTPPAAPRQTQEAAPVERDPAPTESTPAPAAGVEQVAGEPFDAWPDSAKHEVLGMRTQMEQLANRLRNAEGHIGGLNSQLKQQLQRPATARDDAAVPSQAQLREATASPQAMARLKEEYPELGGHLEGVLAEALAKVREEARAAQPTQAPAGVTREELQAQIAELSIETQHKGWKKTVKTPGFAGWLQSQTREVQMLASSPEPEDAVRLLDLHKEAAASSSQNRTQRQTAAAAIPTGRPGFARAKPTDQMTRAELWQHLDATEST